MPNPGLGAAIIVSLAVVAALIGSSVRARQMFPFVAGGYLLMAVISLLASRFFAIDILYLPTAIAIGIALITTQVARLWKAEVQLTHSLFDAARQADSPASDQPNSPLSSGLKLLETELTLTEAIVFQLQDDLYSPVARLRTENRTPTDTSRNSAWRAGLALCERAAADKAIVTQSIEHEGNATTVAVPLLHENLIVGALLLRLSNGLRDEDNALLTAVAAQMARNLQREQFYKEALRVQRLSYLSTAAATKKQDALNVLRGLLTEQKCGENVLEDVNEGVAIAYLDGTLAFVNSALQRLANLSADDRKNLNVFDLLNRFRTDVFDEPAIAVRRVLQSGEAYEGELSFTARSEILGLRISLVRDVLGRGCSGQPLCLAIHVRDLTRAKEYEQLKSDMISLMSHELRTPLTSINGFAELLSAEDGLPDQAREFVTIIGNESQRLSRMINTFLAVTQLERKDKQEVLKIPLKLNDVVRDTIMSLQPLAKKKRIRLIEQPAQKLPPVAADKSLITQAVKNLVNNAIKYSPERTTVTISTTLEAETVRVSVEDRGFGIPPESRDRIWEKFYRVVREGQEKDEESTGLGLSFVREVIEQHGGNVDVESEEGRGSKFSFTLPRL